MILATDTCYGPTWVRTAGVLFRRWRDLKPCATEVLKQDQKATAYAPGAFYLRELPCILSLLERIATRPSTIVIDGYVHLDERGRKGLGAHLFEALGAAVPVVGVAKRPFAGSRHAEAVLRGRSARPLFVTAAGVPTQEAAEAIAGMSGPHRLPTLLKLADRLSRGG